MFYYILLLGRYTHELAEVHLLRLAPGADWGARSRVLSGIGKFKLNWLISRHKAH